MMAPKSPAVNKLLIWHLYSGQAYGIFHGDLDFYFGGFEARRPNRHEEMPHLFLDRRVRLVDHAGNVSSHCEENQGWYIQEHAGIRAFFRQLKTPPDSCRTS